MKNVPTLIIRSFSNYWNQSARIQMLVTISPQERNQTDDAATVVYIILYEINLNSVSLYFLGKAANRIHLLYGYLSWTCSVR